MSHPRPDEDVDDHDDEEEDDVEDDKAKKKTSKKTVTMKMRITPLTARSGVAKWQS